MLKQEESSQLWDLVKPLETAMLITDVAGTMQARPMHLVQKKFDGTFYFFTQVPSEKTNEIQENHQVCLTFSCPKSQVYVSISGYASITSNNELIEELWNPFVAAWFPQGKYDSTVALLKIDCYQAEYWKGKGSKLTQLFKYASAYLSGNTPNIGEHGTI
jgi:general stress protein 26